mmetsp:Transcript_11739/g.24852  ORF Transcript_11739/g.24852 Transcript_11739/m.24852 type:complete len:87 (-) Transcript_11739:126-386(-)
MCIHALATTNVDGGFYIGFDSIRSMEQYGTIQCIQNSKKNNSNRTNKHAEVVVWVVGWPMLPLPTRYASNTTAPNRYRRHELCYRQ